MALTLEMLQQMMEFLDRDGDGAVTKDEFKIPYMKLFPKMTEAEFEEAWKKIDANGDNNLQFEELAAYYGHTLSPSSKRSAASTAELSDEQIMEALQLQAAIFDEKKEQLDAKGASTDSQAIEKEEAAKKEILAKIKLVKLTGSDDTPETGLMTACEMYEQSAIDKGLESTVNIRIEDEKGQMPLHKLARWGYMEGCRKVLELLMQKDALEMRCDINKPDKQGKTPIFYAAEYGHAPVAKLLLDRGVEVMTVNNNGWSVLHSACNANKKEVVEVILTHRRVDAKKLVNLQDNTQRTALMIASFKCEEEVVTMLLSNGADATVADSAGNDAVKLATKTGRRRSRELIENYQAGQ